MTKCGKGLLPECEYYTSAGCVSPFNCPYKVEEISINSATITPDTGIQKYFQGLVRGGVISQEPMNYDAATLKIYIAHLEAENAELRHRLEVAERPLYCLARSFAKAMCKDGDTHHLIEGFIKDAYRQAKEEFAEEKKDD